MVKQIERETGCIKTSASHFYQSVSNMFLVYDREGHSRFMYSVGSRAEIITRGHIKFPHLCVRA